MIYIIYDTALNGPYTLMLLQNTYPVNRSLFTETKDAVLSDVAPYLFLVDENLFKKINGPSVSLEAIVIVESDERINDLLSHFQQFIYENKNGKEYFFRFWDARVLERFLPVYAEVKRHTFFEGVNYFYTTDRQYTKAKSFYLIRDKLQTTDKELQQLFVLNDHAAQYSESENIAIDEKGQQKKERRKYFS